MCKDFSVGYLLYDTYICASSRGKLNELILQIQISSTLSEISQSDRVLASSNESHRAFPLVFPTSLFGEREANGSRIRRAKLGEQLDTQILRCDIAKDERFRAAEKRVGLCNSRSAAIIRRIVENYLDVTSHRRQNTLWRPDVRRRTHRGVI